MRDRKHDSRKFCAACGSPLSSAVRSAVRKTRPHRRFARTAAPRSLVTRHLPLPVTSSCLNNSRDSRHAGTAGRFGGVDGERKTVTALFADIKGSTELMEDLDPEEARAIIDPALKLMIDAVHRYDGYVVQSTGDGIFALFGAPVAHEDHPQRALYAALRMQEEMRRYFGQAAWPRAARRSRFASA